MVVDAERGVLLRCASRLDGMDFDAIEVEEIHFDEQLPEGIFTSREPLPWADLSGNPFRLANPMC